MVKIAMISANDDIVSIRPSVAEIEVTINCNLLDIEDVVTNTLSKR